MIFLFYFLAHLTNMYWNLLYLTLFKGLQEKQSTCHHRLCCLMVPFPSLLSKCRIFMKCGLGQSNSMWSHSLSSKHRKHFFSLQFTQGQTFSREESDQGSRIYKVSSETRQNKNKKGCVPLPQQTHTHKGNSKKGQVPSITQK